MPHVTECPQCQRKLRVPDELLGKKVRCPSCGTSFAAGTSEQALPTAPLQEEDASPPARRKSAPSPAEEYGVEEEAPQRRRRPPEPEEEDLDEETDDDEQEEDYEERPRRRRRRRGAPHRGTTILVLGILSFFCLTPIFGPMAWVMGSKDLKEMRARRMDRSGEGLTNAGRICGIISTILFLIACVFYAGIFGLGIMGGIGGAMKR
jgi:predicted Zn finger-like uncharacterized protein